MVGTVQAFHYLIQLRNSLRQTPTTAPSNNNNEYENACNSLFTSKIVSVYTKYQIISDCIQTFFSFYKVLLVMHK